MKPTIFQEVVARNIPYNSHESDLYIPVTEETTKLLAGWDYRPNVTMFINELDGTLWYDLPFAFEPWWKARVS